MGDSALHSWVPPRFLAVQVLTQVLSDKKPLDKTLDSVEYDNPKDRAWVREVSSGVLRWKTRLDHAIDAHSLKKKPTGRIRKFLWIAVYQLVVQERANPAQVVSETVDAIRKKDGDSPAKFANAVLRKISEERMQWKEIAKPKANASVQLKSIYSGLPESWVKILEADYGWDWVADFGTSSLERPQTWIYANPEWPQSKDFPKSPPEDWDADVKKWPGYQEGQWIVQDLSSQQMIANVIQSTRSNVKTALDCCAAPGGKSIALSWNGVAVDAYDISPERIKLLKQNLDRTKANVKILDSLQGAKRDYDLILIDAPCSGSGILRRHPDVKWNLDLKEIAGLNEKQSELLKENWELLKPGGFLVYSVCSVFKEESSRLLETLGYLKFRQEEWRFGPHLSPSSDGFYAVLLKK